jgi:serine/threonine protein phosphatase PrpC/cytochrome c-type biogenesis protein CcmH/NrfG
MEIKFGVISDKGLNPRRPVNQDSYLALPKQNLFAVFDGVGGQRAGEIASHLAAETIEEEFAHASTNSFPDLINLAIKHANRDICEAAETNADYRTMATTVALIHFSGNQGFIAHVGDSRVYRLEEGIFYHETIDHTDFNDDVRAGLVQETGGGKKSNAINRALGAETDVEIEMKALLVNEGARFLLCSDGIYRHLSDEEMASILAQNTDPQKAAEELKREVIKRGADDNLTAIVLQLGRVSLSQVKGIYDWRSAYLKRNVVSASAANTLAEPSAAKFAKGDLPDAKFSPNQEAGFARESAPNNRIEIPVNSRLEKAESEASGNWPTAAHSYQIAEGSKASRIWKWLLALAVLGALVGLYFWKFSSGVREQAPSVPAEITETASALRRIKEGVERGNGAKLAAELEALVERDPKNAEALYWLGRAQRQQSNEAKANETFDKLIRQQQALVEREPQNADAFYLIGSAELWRGEEKKAVENFEKAIKLQPTMILAYREAAISYISMGQYKKAEEMIQRYKNSAKVTLEP